MTRSPGDQKSPKMRPSCKPHEGPAARGNLSSEEQGGDARSPDSRGRMGKPKTSERSQKAQGLPRQREEATGCRGKRRRSPSVSPRRPHPQDAEREDRKKARRSPAPERRKLQSGSLRRGHPSRGVSARRNWRLQEKHTQRRPPERIRTRGRRSHIPEDPHSSRSLRRHPSAHHSPPQTSQELARLSTHLGALEVFLEELQAPGGAFLPMGGRGGEPRASQRAWLSWQLAHAGAALHWALATLDALLQPQSWPAGSLPCTPAPPWP